MWGIGDGRDMTALTGFLALPFKGELVQNIADDLIQAAKSVDIHLEDMRAEQPRPLTASIISGIREKLDEVDLCVAILDDENPNVFFEIGYAMGTMCPLMLVNAESSTVPADLNALERVVYPDGLSRDERVRRFADAFEKVRKSLQLDDLLELSTEIRKVRRHLSAALERREFLPKHRLYRKCVLHLLHDFGHTAQAWTSSLEFKGREQVLAIGRNNLNFLEQGGFATLYYPGEESWQSNDDARDDEEYLKLSRKIAKQRGLDITRLYVISSEEDLKDVTFRKFVIQDAMAGIQARYILEAQLNALPGNVEKDFGIWDDEMVGVVKFSRRRGRAEIASTTHHYLEKALEDAKTWRHAVVEASRVCTGLPPERDLLHQTYTIQEMKANRRGHHPGYVDANDASWYHASRQYLRLADVVAAPDWHGDFWVNGFRTWREANPNRKRIQILISGQADYGMLYQMIAAVGPTTLPEVTFHVIDRNKVPVEMSRELIGILGDGGSINANDDEAALSVEMRGYVDDILTTTQLSPQSFDIIATDAFLTRFKDRNQKRLMIERWADLLRDGGVVLTTARVKHAVDFADAPRRAEAARDFVRRAVAGWPDEESETAPKSPIEDYAKTYAEKIISYPFESQQDVIDVFTDTSEYEVVQCNDRKLKGELAPSVYVEILARKTSSR